VVALEGALLREHFSLPGLPAVTSRNVLARCLAELGAFTAGLAHGEESRRIAEAIDHPDSLINACRGLGHVYLHKGAWPQAILWLERGLEVCRVWDIPLLLYLVSSTLGYAYVLAGRVSDALPLLEPSASTEGVEILRGRVHGWLSEAYLRLGRLDEALAVAERGLEVCRTHAQQGEQAWALRFLARSTRTTISSRPSEPRPPTVRPWLWPRRWACARSRPTAIGVLGCCMLRPASRSRRVPP
jgi:tetratricopeptide (TPR) repeat protein